jgi:iron complex outermembrane receptor protein
LGYNPINDSKVHQKGVETELDFHLSEKLQGRLAAALIDFNASPYDPNNDFSYKQKTLTPHKSGAFALIYNFDHALQWSNFYYYQPINGNSFSRWDSRVAKRLPLSSGTVTLAATLQHYFDKRPDLLADNQYDGPNKFYFSIDLSF